SIPSEHFTVEDPAAVTTGLALVCNLPRAYALDSSCSAALRLVLSWSLYDRLFSAWTFLLGPIQYRTPGNAQATNNNTAPTNRDRAHCDLADDRRPTSDNCADKSVAPHGPTE